MFQALRSTFLPANQVISVSVGPNSKPTIAAWYLPEPSDVVDILVLLGGSFEGGLTSPTRQPMSSERPR